MYSYEDRIRAVKLYIKLGKRIRPTIRQLGYPTKNALKSWYREYEQSRDLQVGYQTYTDVLQTVFNWFTDVFQPVFKCVSTIAGIGFNNRQSRCCCQHRLLFYCARLMIDLMLCRPEMLGIASLFANLR